MSTVDVINIAADCQKFMTLTAVTGELTAPETISRSRDMVVTTISLERLIVSCRPKFKWFT